MVARCDSTDECSLFTDKVPSNLRARLDYAGKKARMLDKRGYIPDDSFVSVFVKAIKNPFKNFCFTILLTFLKWFFEKKKRNISYCRLVFCYWHF